MSIGLILGVVDFFALMYFAFIYGLVKCIRTRNACEKILGTITAIEKKTRRYYTRDNELHSRTTHFVYIEWEYDGVAYEGMTTDYSISYHVGKDIPVYINPRKPGVLQDANVANYVIGLIVLTVITVITLVVFLTSI